MGLGLLVLEVSGLNLGFEERQASGDAVLFFVVPAPTGQLHQLRQDPWLPRWPAAGKARAFFVVTASRWLTVNSMSDRAHPEIAT